MENDSSFFHTDDGRSSRRNRLMGKLFGKDKKAGDTDSPAGLDSFFQSSADKLNITQPPPPPPSMSSAPKLAKLDTNISSRYPQALAVNQQAQSNRPVASGRTDIITPRRSPKPNRKGTTVHFVDSPPEVIGEGGDEAEIPVVEIANKKPKRQALFGRSGQAPASSDPPKAPPSLGQPGISDDDFVPKPMKRTQTGYSSIYEPELDQSPTSDPPSLPQTTMKQPGLSAIGQGFSAPLRQLGIPDRHDEKRRSFIEVHGAEMRNAEGKAFAQAHRAASATSAVSEQNWQEIEPSLPENLDTSPGAVLARQTSKSPEIPGLAGASYSPAGSIYSSESSLYRSPSNQTQNYGMSRQESIASRTDPPRGSNPAAMSSNRLQEALQNGGEDALAMFVQRVRHLFELFRLHAETLKPLASCSPTQCARAALWWFLKGRMGVEITIRERPSSPRGQMQNEIDRQQAYSNLAKGYWLIKEAAPEMMAAQGLPADPEVRDVEHALISALNKLAMSMKRNGFLPPEEQFLPQTIDKSIWVEYPPLSQDMVALLSGNRGSGVTAMQNPLSQIRLLDALPVGDSKENFNYGRVLTDVYLMEQGVTGQRYHLPCILSMVRPQSKTSLAFILTSQDGSVQLAIQDQRNQGPSWEDLRWRSDTSSLDLRLPRGFMLTLQLSSKDYRMLWGMYDFGSKVRTTLTPRSEEHMVFRNTLKSFQYIDADPNSRSFPKEPVPLCDVAMFERVQKEHGPAGFRNWHRGFRIAVVTHPHTRTLSGVQHTYPPTLPVQFGFFRDESNAPALSLRYESGRQKGRMIFIFNEDKERIRFHCILTGTNLDTNDKMFADVSLKSYTVSQSLREPAGIAPFHRMPWTAARVVNDEIGNANSEFPQTVLSDKLRICLEYKNGTVTDRVNVAPGELRIRLEVSNAKVLRFLRQPQQDFTMSVSESQVPKELPRNMSDALQLLLNNQTIRSVEFPRLQDLHDFEYALTGFEVIFDALAVTFAIARRRMVVPIHKKWEAGYTRIQAVKLEDKQVQLLAFFEDFHHGHCLNFVLKGTDVYESFTRGGKAGIKFVDAKFPLPRLPSDKDGDYDDMAFVCLDLPDLPGEHDDISILFEDESDRDRLCQCLPAPVKGSKLPMRMKA